jgi:hypothetical protein
MGERVSRPETMVVYKRRSGSNIRLYPKASGIAFIYLHLCIRPPTKKKSLYKGMTGARRSLMESSPILRSKILEASHAAMFPTDAQFWRKRDGPST